MYQLYTFPLSQHGRRVVALLEAANLPYETHLVDMRNNEHNSPAYLDINPNHQVPTLIDGDLKIHESNAILRYLCNRHQLENWYPSDPAARAKVDQWLDWTQCRLSPAVVGIVLNKVFLGDKGDKAAIEKGRQQMEELSQILEVQLSQSPFVAGDYVTIADLALASSICQLGFANEIPTSPGIQAWYDKVSALEGFQRSLPQQFFPGQ